MRSARRSAAQVRDLPLEGSSGRRRLRIGLGAAPLVPEVIGEGGDQLVAMCDHRAQVVGDPRESV